MNSLILIRHGNTFGKDDSPVWVGKNEDLPLVESGIEQALTIAEALESKSLGNFNLYTSPLMRALQTAAAIRDEVEILPELNEIDYGSWGGRSTEDLINDGLEQAIEAWDKRAVVPETGWGSSNAELEEQVNRFLSRAEQELQSTSVIGVTSNGFLKLVAKLALPNFDELCEARKLKVKTGHICQIYREGSEWGVASWGVSPEEWASH